MNAAVIRLFRLAQLVVLAAASVKILGGLAAWVGGFIDSSRYPGAFPAWVHAAHVLVFSAAGSLLIAGGRSDVRPRRLGALFVLLGASFSDRLIAGAASSVSTFPAAAAATGLGMLQPEAFIALTTWRFVKDFPRVEGAERLQSLVTIGTAISAVAAAALVMINLLPLDRDRALASGGVASVLAHLTRQPREGSFFWQVLILLVVPAYLLMLRKVPLAPRGERRRVALFVGGIVTGAFPIMVDVILESLIPSFHAFMEEPGRRLMSGVVCYSMLLSVPLTTGYAVLVGHVMDVRLVVRKAIQYSLARVTILVAMVLPIAGIAYALYERRDLTIGELLAGRRALVLSAVTLLCIALFRARRPVLDALDRRFFREQYDARQLLARVADRARSTDDTPAFAGFVETELDRALHVERITLLLVEPDLERLAAPDRRVGPLALSAGLVTLLRGDVSPLELNVELDSSPLRRLSHAEREWVTTNRLQLLVPLLGSDSTLLGAIALGPKRSEQPFSPADRLLLSTVAAAAALMLENRALRSRGSRGSRGSRDATDSVGSENGADDRVEQAPAAMQCQSCGLVQSAEAIACQECGGELGRSILPERLHGKFHVRRLVGVGGMAVVYFATDSDLKRAVALKTLPRISAERVRRLRREAQAMASLQHAHLATIYGMETWKDIPILVVEYFQRGTLADRLRHGRLSIQEVCDLGSSIGDALHYLHQHGLLHRDIKPSNIGLTDDHKPKLLDFGLARVIGRPLPDLRIDGDQETRGQQLSRSGELNLTRSHHVVGTVAYLSPEALRQAPPTEAFDLWSLAVTLYEAVSGTHPFMRATVFETASAIVIGDAPDVRQVRPDCPPTLAELLADCMGRDLDRRPASARDLTDRLNKASR